MSTVLCLFLLRVFRSLPATQRYYARCEDSTLEFYLQELPIEIAITGIFIVMYVRRE
jgi:hypothetical protein